MKDYNNVTLSLLHIMYENFILLPSIQATGLVLALQKVLSLVELAQKFLLLSDTNVTASPITLCPWNQLLQWQKLYGQHKNPQSTSSLRIQSVSCTH